MRLLLISSEFPPGPGGIGTHAYETVRQLQRLGWDVSVAACQDYVSTGEIRAFNASLSFPVFHFPHVPGGSPVEAMFRWHASSSLIKNWRPDLLLATGERSVWLAAVLAKQHRLPMVAFGHGTEFGLGGWQRELNRRAFGSADSVICVSRYTWNEMVSSGIQAKSGAIIPNGADEERFQRLPKDEVRRYRERLKTLQGFDDHAKLIVTVGQVSERKGQDVVIKAMPHVLKRCPNAHYLIAGLPVKQAEYSALARELGVQDRVHFLGKMPGDDLVRLINTSDVFAMTSKRTASGDFEGYGIAVVEAALCGKPAVVSNNSGLAEAIIEGETGFGVPERDEVATADALVRLLNDDNLRTRMGDEARRYGLEVQTWAHRAREYDALLRPLLKNTPVPTKISVLDPLEEISGETRSARS